MTSGSRIAFWYNVLTLAGVKSTGIKGSRQQQQASQYTSCKISLKPSVAAIRGSGSVGGVNTSGSFAQLRQQQQQQQYLQGSGLAQRNSATLSQLIQHPQLAQQQQQQMWQAAGSTQLPGRAFAEQMLQLYNQHGAGAAAASAQQQQQQPLRSVVAVGSHQGAQQQQQQQDPGSPLTRQSVAGLPALEMCSSPVPGADSPSSISNQQQGVQAAGGLESLSSSMAVGMQGLQTAAAAANGRRSPGVAVASMLPLPGRLPGGMTAAAGQVLASSAASYYNGTGPLTGGAKQSWSTGKHGHGMEAGKCLAEVRFYLNVGICKRCDGQCLLHALQAAGCSAASCLQGLRHCRLGFGMQLMLSALKTLF
jgi:hypothetical protein